MRRNRSLARALGPALLLTALLQATPSARAAELPIPGLAHLDGYLHANGGCLMLQQHDGRAYALVGDTAGLLSGDHVRLDGRFVRNPGCGASGFEVVEVRSLWADDDHRNAYFDRANGEPFLRYAQRSGRLDEHDAAAQAGASASAPAEDGDRDRQGAAGEGREQEDARAERGRREGARAERPDREGRHVYKGPHRKAVFVGKLHESEGGCPSLHTTYRVFALDGDLGAYRAGDSVKVTGELFEQDPDAPCGGPTLVITGIRGH